MNIVQSLKKRRIGSCNNNVILSHCLAIVCEIQTQRRKEIRIRLSLFFRKTWNWRTQHIQFNYVRCVFEYGEMSHSILEAVHISVKRHVHRWY